MSKYTKCESCGKIYQTRMKRNHTCHAAENRKKNDQARKQYYRENYTTQERA